MLRKSLYLNLKWLSKEKILEILDILKANDQPINQLARPYLVKGISHESLYILLFTAGEWRLAHPYAIKGRTEVNAKHLDEFLK
ncbi:hypothetical protein [Polluticaenibacter yanchengensis]|uniref:Uncharacterized protein n=1 Tax=Polluticaenibacter yanchengensis TaxID=3014562 RepID=A0ABT4UKP1_9BACT|nr:hypothetical protein [Chitinophagaceae bacterium LY-5]